MGVHLIAHVGITNPFAMVGRTIIAVQVKLARDWLPGIVAEPALSKLVFRCHRLPRASFLSFAIVALKDFVARKRLAILAADPGVGIKGARLEFFARIFLVPLRLQLILHGQQGDPKQGKMNDRGRRQGLACTGHMKTGVLKFPRGVLYCKSLLERLNLLS